jgi:hypothetical protein
MKAFIEVDERSRIGTFWTVRYPGGDILALVISAGPADPWTLRIRVRTYHDDKVFGSEDDKDGYTVTGHGCDEAARDELVACAHAMLEEMARRQQGRVRRIEVNGDDQAFARAFAALPEIHARVVTTGPTTPQ